MIVSGNVESSIVLFVSKLGYQDGIVRRKGSTVGDSDGFGKIVRNPREESQRLGFVVLIPDSTVLRDRRRVIIASCNNRASEPTPVCASVHHVQRNGGGLLCEQVTVENVGKVRADIARASALWTAPWVVGTALELRQEVRLTGRLLVEVGDIVLDVVRDVLAVGAGAFVEVAAPAGGVAVDTGDIDVAGCIALEVVGPRKCTLRIC